MRRMRLRLLAPLLIALCPVATIVVAEQRFYQVMGADGHLQTIMMPDEPAPAKKAESDSGVAAPAESATSTPVPAAPVLPARPPGSPAVVAPQPPSAPAPARSTASDTSGDSSDEEFIDSERLEREGFNIEKKKRFFLLNDGMGSRVEEVQDGLLTDSVNTSVAPPPLDEQGLVARWSNDPVELVSSSDLLSLRKGKPLCLSRKELSGAERVGRSAMRALQVNSRTWQFLGEGDVLKLFAVEGQGLKKLSLISYSRKEKAPAFFMPVIAVADEKGCISRAVTAGYFDRWIGATKTRQHSVQGSFIMLSGDAYVLVLLPDRQPPATSFPLSPLGEVAIHWHD